ncbi:ABC transporter permease subunit [Candidatus Enterococcus murrayae]|uniref:ABC transporter permease subunit n=1 Tax=Candidatus Enterococcus murrayae TaxID=2815321 RepID=A0ABS3HK49_9ENTE|nr:ABC transporter permease subunit [Enterococcus sp. MJM16]MBO0453270.1 ABC transporter permease subunit [Enterococcus sp. MJM16]
MINLVNVEYRRLFKLWSVPLLILLAVFFSYTVLDKVLTGDILPGSFLQSGQATFANSFSVSLTIFGPVILAGFFLGSDFTNRTLHQQVANGHSRRSIVFAKTIVYSSFSAFLLLLTPLLTTVVVSIVNGWGGPFHVDDLLYILRVVVLVTVLNVSVVSIFILISFVCRDIPKTLIMGALFTLVVIELGGWFADRMTQLGDIYKYFPLQQMTVVAQVHLSANQLGKALLSALILWLVSIGASVFLFERQDLR